MGVPDWGHSFDRKGERLKQGWINSAAAAYQGRSCFDKAPRMVRCFIG
jgi:hypothetical protein